MHERGLTPVFSRRARGPLPLGLALLLSSASYGRVARAFDFGWDVPEGCPSAEFVEQEVTRIVGRPWAELGADWREARASITAETRGFRLRLRVNAA